MIRLVARFSWLCSASRRDQAGRTLDTLNRDTGTDYACSIASEITDLTSGNTFTIAAYGVSDEHPSPAGTDATCSKSITYNPRNAVTL